jgi:hypothetical protein
VVQLQLVVMADLLGEVGNQVLLELSETVVTVATMQLLLAVAVAVDVTAVAAVVLTTVVQVPTAAAAVAVDQASTLLAELARKVFKLVMAKWLLPTQLALLQLRLLILGLIASVIKST